MPTRPSSVCDHPGCPELTDKGAYCATHRTATEAADREHRGTSTQRGYDARHRRWRKLVIAKNPLCVHCKPDRITLTTVADHIVPLDPNNPSAGDWSLENGQGLCQPCHNRKTMEDNRHGQE